MWSDFRFHSTGRLLLGGRLALPVASSAGKEVAVRVLCCFEVGS